MNQKNLVYVVYDGIQNPVFQGQVIKPLLNELEKNPELQIHLIAFEKESFPEEVIYNLIPQRTNLNFVKFKRFSVLGKISLLHSVYLLKNFLNQLDTYSIKARGPLAGWISLSAMDKDRCKSFMVQARGLIAVEYELIYSRNNLLKFILCEIRKKIFQGIESEIYNPKFYPKNFLIESITSELANYLINFYKANQSSIIIAQEDFPAQIGKNQILLWRAKIRKNLAIPENFYVYCYNGSAKPWQSLDETISFFKNQLEKDTNIFLLVLTQDETAFEQLLIDQKVDKKYFKICNVRHEEIYEYLSACDAGLLFRKPHLANWISRPVKAMEYQAVNLKIIHNNTVKWLIDGNM